MLRQHLLAEFVLLTERNRFHPRPLQPQREAADPAEEIEDAHYAARG